MVVRLLRITRRIERILPTTPVVYPNGSFIRTEKGYFYIMDSNRRLRILTKRVLNSWNPARVIETSEAAVQNHRISSKLKFRNGSLIHNLADGKIYLIVDGKRCHITSPDVFTRIGAKGTREDVVSVSLAETKLHEEGEPLT